LGLLIFKFN